MGGAALINEGEADVVMNWSGGMHHAKKGEASGGFPVARLCGALLCPLAFSLAAWGLSLQRAQGAATPAQAARQPCVLVRIALA